MIIKYNGGGGLKALASDVLKSQGGDWSSITNLVGSQMAQSGGNSNGYWGNGGAEAVGGVVSQAPELLKNIKAGGGVGWGAAMNAAASLIDPMVKEGTTESGEYGDLTKKIDGFYDKGADVLLNSGNPLGMVIGGAMKLNAVAGDAISNQSINGRALGTSGNTKSDAILGSAFFESNLGALNAYFGEDMNELEYDKKAWDTVGSSYAGSQKSVKDASDNTGGRYGWLSTITGEYQKDLEQNKEADRQQTMVSKISDEATENSQIASSTLQEATMNQQKKLQGQSFTFRVQKGMKLPTKEDIQKTKKLLEEPKIIHQDYTMVYQVDDDITFVYKDGGKSKNKNEKPKTRSIEELIQYAKEVNPRFIQRMSEPLRYIRINTKNENGDSMWDHATHMMNYRDNIVYPMIQEINGKLHMFNNEDEAFEYAKATENVLNFDSEDEAKLFAVSDKDENGNYFGYKLGWPEFFETSPIDVKEESSVDKFKEGGKMNIIPEGELHARLHHMEQEGITKKGIPVISIEEGGEVIQHAEIERNEIIFHLELTQKLEQLMEDGSDEAAIEAGKLLVDEILNNTEDRTGLLNEVE